MQLTVVCKRFSLLLSDLLVILQFVFHWSHFLYTNIYTFFEGLQKLFSKKLQAQKKFKSQSRKEDTAFFNSMLLNSFTFGQTIHLLSLNSLWGNSGVTTSGMLGTEEFNPRCVVIFHYFAMEHGLLKSM